MESSEQPGGDTGSAPVNDGGASGGSPPPPPSGSSASRISGKDFERVASVDRTSQPGATDDPSAAAPKAPVPHDRFEEVNGKYQGLKWAENYTPDKVQAAVQMYEWLDNDPRAAGRYIVEQLRTAGLLEPEQTATRPPAHVDPTVDAQGRPMPDLEVEGTGQKLYSAEQAQRLADWLLSKVDERFKPITEERDRAKIISQTRTEASHMVADAQSWPHFTEYMVEIDAELAKRGDADLRAAYQAVVYPKLESLHRTKFASEMRTRANGSTRNPGAASASSTVETRKLPLRTLIQREAQRRGIGK